MFEKLVLINFQPHGKRVIEFDRITTFIGPTDAGKSAIFRALECLCFNFPVSWTEFIKHNKNTLKIKLYVDGHTITRLRNKTANEYWLDKKPYKAFAKGVPPSIEELLNVSQANFQSQLDGPFWFDLTPGQVSKELNRIVDLSVIDNSLAEASSRLRKASTTIEVIEQRRTKLLEQMEGLKWVKQMDMDLRDLEAKSLELENKHATATALAATLRKATQAQEALNNLKAALLEAQKRLKLAKCSLDLQKWKGHTKRTLKNIRWTRLRLKHLRIRRDNMIKKINLITKGACPICNRPLDDVTLETA